MMQVVGSSGLARVCAVLLAFIVGVCRVEAQEQFDNPYLEGRDFKCVLELDSGRLVVSSAKLQSLDQVQVFVLEDPTRLVIDLPGLNVGRPQILRVINSPLIHRVRAAQQGSSARVVLDLKGLVTASKSSSARSGELILELAPNLEASARPTSPALVSALPTVPQPIAEPSVAQAVDTPTTATSPKLPDVEVSVPKRSILPENVLKFSVDDTFVSFEPGDRPLKDVTVVNKTDQELFLRSDVQEVLSAGQPDERYQNSKMIVASPRRFVLPPLASRPVRMVLSEGVPSEGERVFRLILSPEESEASRVEVEGLVNEVPSKVRVVAGLGVTVTVPSATANGLVGVESKGRGVTLRNTGERIVVVEGCSACPLTKDACVSSPRKLLYPGIDWTLPVTGSGVVNCDLRIGKAIQRLTSFYGSKEEK